MSPLPFSSTASKLPHSSEESTLEEASLLLSEEDELLLRAFMILAPEVLGFTGGGDFIETPRMRSPREKANKGWI